MISKRKQRKPRSKPYSKGELNRLVDSLCHPFYKENEALRLVDGLLHGLVEQNPPMSVRKFIQYNLPEIIKKLQELR